ncbi:MAG TPA: VTT domain-containing protein [Bryobacteraceae bacterium]|nr:VTT domain-containing protein [Bryobacteraceae bacterium]
MLLIRQLILIHGYAFVFGYVFAVQSGLPIPADPMLLVMGAMVGEGRYSYMLALLAGVAGALLGDFIWYELGRRRGRSVVKFLCRWSMEPDSCVRATEERFAKGGARALLLAKFIPGMSLVSVPLAGMIRMPRSVFIMWDTASSVLWTGSYLLLGAIFHRQVQDVIDALSGLGRWAIVLLAGLLALYIGYKRFERWLFLRRLRMARIEPQEVAELLRENTPLNIVDLRHPLEVEREGLKIVGARVLRPDELRSRSGEIPRDQEIILYCS